MTALYNDIFKNKTVLITGHTGFKGSWLALWLHKLGAKVIGLSNQIPSKPAHYLVSAVETLVTDHRVDIRDDKAVMDIVTHNQPDFVFHLAAQSLVQHSYRQPSETITTNAMGTVSVLEALRHADWPVVALLITSDKVYDNVEWVWGYREDDRLGGKDPYSASKAMAELAIKTYGASYFADQKTPVRYAIARAGNVIGGGDWALDRILPDCVRSWSANKAVAIRSPQATRPWQHVLEPLSGYLQLAAKLHQSRQYHAEAYNFGPAADQNHSVASLLTTMQQSWSEAQWQDTSLNNQQPKEACLLKLNCDKALQHLHWRPCLDFATTVRMTVEWYKRYYQDSSACMQAFTRQQIEDYEKIRVLV